VSKDSEKPLVGRESRRSFLGKLGLGAAAVALFSAPFLRLGRGNSGDASDTSGEFPGKDSIFHPARDPRLDPRRNSHG
jgi:hypothetical protein